MFDRRARGPVSHYPKFTFHLLRFLQLISSLVVGAIMGYFIWHLRYNYKAVPWTFIWLMTASVASITALAFTIFFHCCTGLHPRTNVVINSGLAAFWILSWGLLFGNMTDTLLHTCDVDHWNEDVGIMICRIYKALFAFALLGLVSTIAALSLDLYVLRANNRRGIYRLQDMDSKTHLRNASGSYGQGGLAAPRESEAWEAPRSFMTTQEATSRPSIGPYTESYNSEKRAQGYTIPEKQFAYDTGYQGAHL